MKKESNHTIIDQIRARYSGEQMILLESQMPDHPSSEVSYLAIKPLNSIRSYGNRIEWAINGKKESFEENPWEALKVFRDNTSSWLFGYLGYELKDFIEDLQSRNQPLTHLPDLCFFEPEVLFRISNGVAEQWTDRDKFQPVQIDVPDKNLKTISSVNFNLGGEKPVPMTDRETYCKTVQDIQKRIGEGDFYELNFSYPLMGEFRGDSYDLYKKMRQVNPVPFGSYLMIDDFSACCASPERFLRKKGNRVKSEPIKGTTERAAEPDLDQKRKEELMNEKNRAENLMIVDLVRHDLSKIAIKGSVKVSKLYDIQSFGTVHQLISTIEADVDKERHPVEIIKSCFPMGSMTGAPKIEVMKVIDEIESYRRGLYSGAIGYFDPDGDFDFNVVIRTAIVQNQRIIYPVGGAITSDSDPEQEWTETEIKSRAITKVFNE